MKSVFKIMVSASFVFCGSTYAADALPVKPVNVPFTHVSIFDKEHEGLSFNYDLTGGKKVVCQLTDIYKAWLETPSEGAAQESNTFGGFQLVALSNTEQTHNVNEWVSVIHVDASGTVKINETKELAGSVSCHYEEEVK